MTGQAIDPSPSLPVPNQQVHSPGVYLLHPLSRLGTGPGMIILTSGRDLGGVRLDDEVPSPFLKWAEEGYAVAAVCLGALEGEQDGISSALEALSGCNNCQPKGKVGLIGEYSTITYLNTAANILVPAYDPGAWLKVAASAHAHQEVVGVVVYGNVDSPIPKPVFPMLRHLAGASATAKIVSKTENCQAYGYAAVSTHQFATPFQPAFDYTAESVSHTRNLSFLKPLMGGPFFDLEAIWEEHTYHEFETRSVPHTMATMVQEPYVNHIPTVRSKVPNTF